MWISKKKIGLFLEIDNLYFVQCLYFCDILGKGWDEEVYLKRKTQRNFSSL